MSKFQVGLLLLGFTTLYFINEWVLIANKSPFATGY